MGIRTYISFDTDIENTVSQPLRVQGLYIFQEEPREDKLRVGVDTQGDFRTRDEDIGDDQPRSGVYFPAKTKS